MDQSNNSKTESDPSIKLERQNAVNPDLEDDDEIYSRYRNHVGYFGRQISVDATQEPPNLENFSRYGYYGRVITDIERTVDPDATPYQPRPDDFFRRIVLHCNKDPHHRLTIYGNLHKDEGSEPSAKKQRN